MDQPEDSSVGPENPRPTEAGSFAFGETQWSMVINAAHGDLKSAAIALERLCRIYWRPIYGFIRWQRHLDHYQTEDLTQAFFAHLLSNETLKKAKRGEGRFRTFLLAVLVNFLSDERRRQGAQKRGARFKIVSLNEITARDSLQDELSQPPAPDKYYDHQWAVTLVQHALARLRAESGKEGNDDLYAKLEPALTNADDAASHAELAAALGRTAGAVRVALHRLRGRFREILRDEVAQTVSTPEQTDEELRHLVEALAV